MRILVLNAGSSSLKFQVIACVADKEERLASGKVERIGSDAQARYSLAGQPRQKHAVPGEDIQSAITWLAQWLREQSAVLSSIDAVGHRVVHGGERFSESVVIDASVLAGIEECAQWAPLHNRANLAGITAITAAYGDAIPQVAVFDTAFHRTLPEAAFRYALPSRLYEEHGIRRYGFHGTSHRYLEQRYRQLRNQQLQLPASEDSKIVTLHLGNGCSATAIRAGKSVETSMGMTPLEGLVMGTRSGDIDPALLEFLAQKEGLSVQEATSLLNNKSGLLGLSGYTNDMRNLVADAPTNPQAALAIEVFCHRIRKYVGAYLAVLGGADAVIFSGGIGENSALVRARVCQSFSWAGLQFDEAANQSFNGKEGRITLPGSRLHAYVIPTDEEVLIARDTIQLLIPASGNR